METNDKAKTTKPPRPLKVEQTGDGREYIELRTRNGENVYEVEVMQGAPRTLFILGDGSPERLRRLLPHLQAWCDTGSLRLGD